ncbi:dTDP-Rha:alpha-D-GlcNAc-pyrophosphate polyprenol, alpha-3-L-rhamnosyltransferase [Serratia grimesii]|jgi:GT2 family glycosyltransferase|uniref:glycosyltransferase n=1 Tax=Serratia grimesii TaxID=82995 RepID=UPI002178327E|nr:glycosyltransferase family 2 protein [Serratia grimesii]CAI0798086.1 dTDP-Rha:alpha-D-GlcNAc-pyrophosphate polyprenol, alpha-3-L-rhamnosyltransferase [Serratia grimesii]CAI2785641.1 dTDP-Rha:alpha-D-GlcNAc-pyrophosphate polyprenol, alpha-3-L-rhamnosyltransferase [Serratia grimesii]
MAVEQEKFQIVASIVLFNHSYEQVEETLTSLLNEQCVGKIVLVNNGGADWAASLGNDRIGYIHSTINGGFGHAHNLCMSSYLDRCDYFLICNPDISFEAGALARLYNFAHKEGHQFVSPRIRYSDGRFQHSCRLLPTPANLFLRRFLPKWGSKMDVAYELHQADYEQTFAVPSVSGCFMLLKSTLLGQLGGFDERYFMYMEDVDLCRRALKLTDIVYFSGTTITHVFGKGSYKSLTLLGYHMHSAILYFNKWGWIFDRERCHYNQKYLKTIPITSLRDDL